MTQDIPQLPEGHELQMSDLFAKLKTFLMTPDHGDGSSWPDISVEELREARTLIRELLLLKWGKDCDGDEPVTLSLLYRRKSRLPWDIPLSLSSMDETPEQEKERVQQNLYRISGAIASYAQALEQHTRQLQDIQRAEVAKSYEFPVYVVAYSSFPEEWKAQHKNDHPCSLHASPEDARAFVPPEGFVRKEEQIWIYYANPINEAGQITPEVAAMYKQEIQALFDTIQPKVTGLFRKIPQPCARALRW